MSAAINARACGLKTILRADGQVTDESLRILCFGDIVGRPGRNAFKQHCKRLRADYNADLVVANGENSAGGVGIDRECARELLDAGIDLLTLGDHTWQKRDIREFLETHRDSIIRPGNYPAGAPGAGWAKRKLANGKLVGFMNLMGRVFISVPLDCPFRVADEILNTHLADCDAIVCDMHAEATSEKLALGRYLDGKISLLFGTHTHVQTADERILPGGTGFISDLGMSGPASGVIGMDGDVALKRFLTGMPHAYEVAKGDVQLNGIFAELSLAQRRALSIKRVSIPA